MITSLRLAAKVNEEEEVGVHGSRLWAAFEVEECNTGALRLPEKAVSLGMLGMLENSLTSQDLCSPFSSLIAPQTPTNGHLEQLNPPGPADPEA